MRCPKHPDEWLYENMMETKGWCKKCKVWYALNTHSSDKAVKGK